MGEAVEELPQNEVSSPRSPFSAGYGTDDLSPCAGLEISSVTAALRRREDSFAATPSSCTWLALLPKWLLDYSLNSS